MDIKYLLKYSISLFLPIVLLTVFQFGCSSDNNTVTNPTIGTVNGTVADYYGNPVQGATVQLKGQNAVTGSDGKFSFPDVTVPYDLNIADITGAAGIVYRGLTAFSPQLYRFGSSLNHNECTLNVSLPSISVNQKAMVVFTDGQNIQIGSSITAPNLLTSYTPDWYNTSASITGKVIVLIFTLNGSQVVSYDKYGESPGVVLTNGGTVTVAFQPGELTLDPVESTVSGSVTVPAGYIAPNNSLAIRFTTMGGLSRYSGLEFAQSSSLFSFNVPTGLTSSCKLLIISSSAGPQNQHSSKIFEVTPGSANNQITLEEAPALSAPAENTAGVDTSITFTYSSGSTTGVFIVSFHANDRDFYVVQNATSTKIPDFSSFGLAIGQNLGYSWNVAKYGGVPTVDSFVSTWPDNNSNVNGGLTSETRHFTTAP